jgi:hypothetical protein
VHILWGNNKELHVKTQVSIVSMFDNQVPVQSCECQIKRIQLYFEINAWNENEKADPKN